MTDDQRTTLKWAFEWGSGYNMGESMRAICWQESSAGADLENEEDGTEGSYGYFGNNPVIVATRVYDTWPDRPTDHQIAECKEQLLIDPEFCARQCRDEIIYWQGEYQPNHWTKIWGSYNAGHKYWKGKGYAREIMDKIIFLRGVT